MKVLVTEDPTEGFEKLLGSRVTLLCTNYFYTGVLSGVNTTCVLLTNPSIVYETGKWAESVWALAEKLPTNALYVQRAAIEAFGVLK